MKKSELPRLPLHVTPTARQVHWFDRRNREIAAGFHALYGRMPTMRIYSRLAEEYGLSEDSVRRIVRRCT